MTEAEWLACEEPYALLSHLKDEISVRKWRLLGVALIRSDLPWQHLGNRALTEAEWEQTRPILDTIESRADAVLAGAVEAVLDFDFHHWLDVAEMFHGGNQDERAIETQLIRDIFGNPFRPVTFAPEWRTDTAVALARGMYESRDFGAMPILADALQDAGCDNDDILSHCRGALPSRPLSEAEPGERDSGVTHVRGCWVVDLVLGKE